MDRRDDRRRGGGNAGRYEAGDNTRETGLIEKLCDSYGFIDCVDRRQKLFFHYTNVRGEVHDLRLGDGLEFRVATDRRTGKLVACDVILLPPGTVSVESISEERVLGVVEREPGRRETDLGRIAYTGADGSTQKVSFSPRDVAEDVNLAANDKVDFNLATDKRDGRMRAVRVLLVERAALDSGYGVVTALKESFGFLERDSKFGEGEIFFHYSEVDGDVSSLRLGTDVMYAEAKQGSKLRAVSVKPLPAGHFDVIDPNVINGVVVHAIAPPRGQQGRRPEAALGKLEYINGEGNKTKLSFGRKDLSEQDTVLRKGDKVAFNLCVDGRYPTRRRAVNVVRTGGPDTGPRETGVVDVVKEDYGFIRCCERPVRAFFHFAELLDANVEPRVGDEVEFFVMTDSEDNKEWAIRIGLLPPGSVAFETFSDEVVNGYVVKTAHAPRRGVVAKASEPQPVVPDVVDINDEASDSERLSEVPAPSSVVSLTSPPQSPPPAPIITYTNASLVDKNVKLRAGDKITFRIATEKATGERRAVDITLVERAPDKMDRGYICALRPDFGFIENTQHNACVFFHSNDLVDFKIEQLALGTEVEYVMGRSKGKTAAKTVRVVPDDARSSSAEVDEDVLIGTVQRAYTANATAEASKYGGLIQYESDKCELLKYPFGITALDNSRGEGAHPRIGSTVSFQLLATSQANAKKRRATNVRAVYDTVDESAPRTKGKITEIAGPKGTITADSKVYSFYTYEVQDGASVSTGDDVDFVVQRNQVTGADDACRIRKAYARKGKLVESNFGPVRQPRGPEGKGWALRQSAA